MNIEWFTSPDTRNHCGNHNEFSQAAHAATRLEVLGSYVRNGTFVKVGGFDVFIFQFKQQKQRPKVTKIS